MVSVGWHQLEKSRNIGVWFLFHHVLPLEVQLLLQFELLFLWLPNPLPSEIPQYLWAAVPALSIRSAALKNIFLGELKPHKQSLGKKRDSLMKAVDSVKVGYISCDFKNLNPSTVGVSVIMIIEFNWTSIVIIEFNCQHIFIQIPHKF